MATVTLNNVRKIYAGDSKNPDFLAVKDIDLEIHDKEFMVLVGPSGCSKSTTLRMIAGLEDITAGTITIGDRIVNDILPKDRDIAMVFQNYALYPHMTLFDNMAFGLKIAKVSRQETKQRVNEAAEILGLTDMLQRKPKALSGGQRQRVALGRAIVRNPKVFLFDEPLSNLDAKMRVQMRTEISRLHTKLNATMIYVTHDQTEAMTMGDRICVMKDGHIMQVDDPLNIYNHPVNMFVAGFIGSPPMNFLYGQIRESDGNLFFEEKPGKNESMRIPLGAAFRKKAASSVGKTIVLGFRPESIKRAVVASESDAPSTATALLEVVEPMGSETFLYLSSGSHSFVVKVEATERFKVNSRMAIEFDQDKIYLFDPDTEKVL